MGVTSQRRVPTDLPPGQKTRTSLQKAGWAPAWTGAENLALAGIRFPDCPACSESLSRIRYPSPFRPSDKVYNFSWFAYSLHTHVTALTSVTHSL
jgi:hypothetical protein